MRKTVSISFMAAAAAAFGALTDYVDPFVGTAGTGHTHPAACRPFGMVQAGPDTGCNDWSYCSGYQYKDGAVIGYSQTHLSGTGCPDCGDVQILPFTGDFGVMPMRRKIDKSSEKATPGYYSVVQPEDDICVEIAATQRAAIYRMSGGRNSEIKVLVNLPFGLGDHVYEPDADKVNVRTDGAKSEVVEAHGLRGEYFRTGWISRRKVAYAIEFDRDWLRLERVPGTLGTPDEAPRYVATFASGLRPLMMKVGLSATGASGAAKNLDAEIPGWDFDGVRVAAGDVWNVLLSRMTCEGSEDQRRSWYTALYHLCSQPNNIADVGEKPFYSTFSTWDTFRAAHPLYTIIVPEKEAEFVDSMLEQGRRTGYLPVWSLWGIENQCMIGTHSVPVIVDWFLKECGNVELWKYENMETANGDDTNPVNPVNPLKKQKDYWLSAYAQIKDTLTKPHEGRIKERWDLLDKYGYYPFDKIKGESVSRTMECAYDDWCAGMMAQKLGEWGTGDGERDESLKADAEFFFKRSENWRNVFDPTIGLVRGKDSKGNWREPYNPYEIGHGADLANDFTEGNAFQYTWHVLQNPKGLVDAMGGRDMFVKKLDSLFLHPEKVEGPGCVVDVTGLIGQYVHGNEPSHHVIYFYPQVGYPGRAAERIRDVFDRFYINKPDGLCGNDDCGQMSAWYLFSAMGFYPFNPCGGEYIIGAPQVPKVTLSTRSTCSTRPNNFTIIAKNLSRENKYVKSVTLNGKPIVDWKIRHSDIMAGGELVFEMTSVAPDFNRHANPTAAYYRKRLASPDWGADRWRMSPPLDLKAADRIAAGEVTVVNIPWAFPSNRIDWLFNPTKEMGPFNPEWTWQLNRMEGWTTLARAYDETGDEKYARAFAGQFADWIGQTGGVPSESGYNEVDSPWRTIEEGLRLSRSWHAAFEVFRKSPSFPDDLLLAFVQSSEAQARHLLSHSTGYNWLLMEMSGVYVFAVTFPEIPGAEEMRKEALRRFTAAVRAQLLPDGIHDELSPDYHGVLYSTMAEIYRLAIAAGLEGELPADFRDCLRRGAEGTLAMTTPGFVLPRFNDCYTIPASFVLRHASDFFPERSDFLWGASGGRKGAPPCGETASRYLPYAGFAVMRGGWSEDSSYLAFDVGPLGMNHDHQDKLSFTFWKGAEELVFDDGGGQYEDSELRRYALSGHDHNTLLVDGFAQNRQEPRKSGCPIDAGWTTSPEGDFAFGVYDQGFGPEMAKLAVHRREIRFDKVADAFTVTDDVRSADGAEHEYALLFHLDATNVVIAADGRSLRADYGHGRKWALEMSFDGAERVSAAVGRTSPSLAGWFVGRNDLRTHPATTVFVTAPRSREHKFVTKFKAVLAKRQKPEGVVEWLFPRMGNCHEGMAFSDGVTGVLVWGGGDELRLTIGRADLWDHRGGYPWTDEQCYTNIVALWRARQDERLRSLFKKSTPAVEPRNPYMLPLGRVVVKVHGKTLKRGWLDTRTGLAAIEFAEGGQVELAMSKADRAFAARFPAGVAYDVKSVPATETAVYEKSLKSVGFEKAVSFDGAIEGNGGFRWRLPADESVWLSWRKHGGDLCLRTGRGGEVVSGGCDYGKVAAASTAQWRRFWQEGARVKVPDPVIQRIFDYGMYRFGAMTDPEGVPAGLQGPWLEDEMLVPWNGDYHFNINVQACYSPAFRGGHFAHLMPLFRMILSWRPLLRENARKFCGIDDGYVLPHSVDDRGVCIGGFWTGTIDHASAAWMASYMYRYVKYSGDLAFLKDGAYDFMKGAMNVYLAMLEERDGRLSIPLGPSPEWMGTDTRRAVGRNPSFQLAACHRLAQDLIDAAARIGETPDARWLDVEKRLPAFSRITETVGDAAVWGNAVSDGLAIFEGVNLHESHRHHSHLAGLYPFDTIPRGKGENREMIDSSYENWTLRGTGLWTGWCVPWASVLHVDAGNAVAAVQMLRAWDAYFCDEGHGSHHNAVFDGFTNLRNGRDVMQMDGQCAAATAVLELLVHEINGEVHYFRGCPDMWRDVSFENVALSDGRRVSGRRTNGLVTIKPCERSP